MIVLARGPLASLLPLSAALASLTSISAFAQESPKPGSATPVTAGSPSSQAVAAETPGAARHHPFGNLSDPSVPASSFFASLVEGKVNLDNRARYEWAETTGRRPSNALTNRLRLGYGSKPFHGLSFYAEMENVTAANDNWYWVPAAGQGDPTRTTISDPEGTELNQGLGRFQTPSIGESGPSLDVRVGRQRVKLDDERFIGSVGWRQFEQTFDAASVESDLGIKGLTVQYAYVWHVQRIFGPDGPNYESQSHLIRSSYAVAPELRVTPFAYLLDFDTDAPADSVDTYGVRLTGDLGRGSEGKDANQSYFDYELVYAYQVDAGRNPTDVAANFFAAQLRFNKVGFGAIQAGYQLLGSDDGVTAFRFPLGTNHKFQGYADQFVATPPFGLHDAYVGVFADLPGGIKSEFTIHQFWSDEGGDDLGYELDGVLSKKLRPNWTVLFKAAYFDGHNGQPDLARVWLETTFSF